MSFKSVIEQFKQLSPATQVALIVLVLGVVILLVIYPAAGTSIITFLVALKMLGTHR